jgi:hypothetical protein
MKFIYVSYILSLKVILYGINNSMHETKFVYIEPSESVTHGIMLVFKISDCGAFQSFGLGMLNWYPLDSSFHAK